MRATLSVALALIASSPLAAQNWTAQEREVIAFQQRCWDLWAAEDTEGYLRDCGTHPAYAFWDAAEAVPFQSFSEDILRDFFDVLNSSQDVVHVELRPVAVRIVDNVAMLHYWGSWMERQPDGTVKTSAQKRLDVMIRRNGTWMRLGGMSIADGDRS